MRLNNSNIVFNKILKSDAEANGRVATYKGITIKTLVYLALTLVGAFGGLAIASVNPSIYVTLIVVSGLLTFIFSLISFLSVRACPVTGAIYCLMEGCLIGAISMVVATFYEGAVSAALLATIAVFAVVVTLFVSNIVKVNGRFMKFLLIFAISFIVSQLLFMLVASIFSIEINYGITLLISAITVFLASLYLFFDLERIRQVVEGGYSKDYEWYVSFGLAFTLIWLYVEILRIVVVIFGNRK